MLGCLKNGSSLGAMWDSLSSSAFFIFVFLFFSVGLPGRNLYLALVLPPLFAGFGYTVFPLKYVASLSARWDEENKRVCGSIVGVVCLFLLHLLAIALVVASRIANAPKFIPTINYVPDIFEFIVLLSVVFGGYVLLYFYLWFAVPMVKPMKVLRGSIIREGFVKIFLLGTVVYDMGCLVVAYLVRQRALDMILLDFPRVVVFVFGDLILMIILMILLFLGGMIRQGLSYKSPS